MTNNISENSKILFSVVVAVFNIENYISQCIESIINQTYQNLEIILVDDGSTDSSGTICNSYAAKDSRIRVIHKNNAGLGEARNTGLSVATGQYIAFIDGDDFIDAQLFDKAAFYLKRYKNTEILDFDIGYFKNKIVYNKYKRIGVQQYKEKDEIQSILFPNMIYNKKNKLCLYCCSWNKIYSTNFLSNIKFKFVSERKYISEDYYANLILYSKVNYVLLIPERLYFYRFNETSLTHIFKFDRFEKNIFQFKQSLLLANEFKKPELLCSLLAFQIFTNLENQFKQLILRKDYKELKREFADSEFQKMIHYIVHIKLSFFQKALIFTCKSRFFIGFCALFIFSLTIKKGI